MKKLFIIFIAQLLVRNYISEVGANVLDLHS